MKWTVDHHALWFAICTRILMKRYGWAKAEVLSKEIVCAYGKRRGERMRDNAVKNDLEPSINAFLITGELPLCQDQSVCCLFSKEDHTVSEVLKCPWHDVFMKYGYAREGAYYCHCIDQALLEGFQASFHLFTEASMADGDGCCRFIWDQAYDRDMVEREKKKHDFTRPWSFHIKELMDLTETVLNQRIPQESREVFACAERAFAEECADLSGNYEV